MNDREKETLLEALAQIYDGQKTALEQHGGIPQQSIEGRRTLESMIDEGNERLPDDPLTQHRRS